jgi:hypothetical protein
MFNISASSAQCTYIIHSCVEERKYTSDKLQKKKKPQEFKYLIEKPISIK